VLLVEYLEVSPISPLMAENRNSDKGSMTKITVKKAQYRKFSPRAVTQSLHGSALFHLAGEMSHVPEARPAGHERF
jgi:hypothetical protein